MVGIDNAPAMLDKARRKAEQYRTTSHIQFLEEDITACALPQAGAIICNYTLQFIRPLSRPEVVRRLYQALPDQGLLILSEKVISHAGLLNRRYIDIYHRFKKHQGYSDLEIAAKREALENVLIPCSREENLALLRQAGFQEVESFFQWFNFTSYVAIKRSSCPPKTQNQLGQQIPVHDD
jgi:tRNA (cmo5U34)-methyltransferase